MVEPRADDRATLTEELAHLRAQVEAGESALRESEARFHALANAVPTIIWTAAPDGAITYANDRWFRYCGIEPEQNARGWPELVLHPDDRERCLEQWTRALREGTDYEIEVRNRRNDGEYRWFLTRASPVRGDDGRVTAWFGSTTDIHDRKQAEAERAWLADAVTNAADSLVVRKLDGTITVWSPGAQRLFGYTPQEVIGQRVELLVPPERQAEVAEFNARVARGETIDQFESVRVRKDGSLIEVSMSLSPVRDPSGRVVALAAIGRDIFERRSLERAQRDFTANVVHELRNPLAAIRGFAQLLQRRGAYDERAVDAIIAQTRGLERLIGDLMDASLLESEGPRLRPEPLDLVAKALDSAEEARATSDRHTIRVEAPERPLIGSWDADRLAQIFRNLLGNAIKYSPGGGEMVVRVRDLGHEAEVSIRDGGVGIPTAQLSRLFDRFYRVADSSGDTKGLGLGLYVTRELVEAHGGRIWAESAGPGTGSTFHFTLPLGTDAGEPVDDGVAGRIGDRVE